MNRIPPYESDVVEFKSEFAKDRIKRTVTAFANTFGGDLYIGVNDDGSVCGLEDIHAVEEQLWNMLRDNIFPSVIGCVDAERLIADGKDVLHVHVARGPNPPYSLAMDDPRQVYVRAGSTSAPARIEDIARMVERKNPVPFEKRASQVQELTFNECGEFCRLSGVEFDPKANANFGFWDRRKLMWTNLAFICSDQSDCEMHLIRFRDAEMTQIADSEKVRGSVFLILQRALSFVDRFNRLDIEKPVDGSLQRKDTYAVHPEAVREAIVNQLVHRDYRRAVASHIHISPEKIDFWSAGGLHDLNPRDIFEEMATSCRNPGLSALFTLLRLMEGLGTGYRLIRALYSGLPPERLVIISPDSLKVSLPRVTPIRMQDLDERQRKILEAVIAVGSVKRIDVEELIGVAPVTAVGILKKLVDMGALVKEGAGPRTRYGLSPAAMPLFSKVQGRAN